MVSIEFRRILFHEESNEVGEEDSTTKPRSMGKSATKQPKTTTGRDGTKKAIVLGLLSRREGATLVEITEATGWQNHSIRGFIGGSLAKRMGLKVESSKNEAGDRTYRISE